MSSKVLAGRYSLDESLSTTPMAEVFAGTDAVLERRVVVKLLAPTADRIRFEREAKAAAALADPHIVQLFDYGEEGARPFMVFEYLPGGSLEQRLGDPGPLADHETARIAADIAAGLAHAHNRSVVHRDLKPANVLFDGEARAKIADFGIAHVMDADTLTEAGTILGTAAYISPEQAGGEAASPASDVYSFGVLLYRMLSGRLPFESDDLLELAAMHRTREPVPLATLRHDVPRALAELAMAALAKDPTARPPDGSALVAALGTAPSTSPGEAETVVMPTPPSRPRLSRRRSLGSAAGLTLLVAAGVAAAVLLTGRNGPAPAPAVPVRNSGSTSAGSHPARGASPASPTTTSARSTSTTKRTTSTAATVTHAATSATVPVPISTTTPTESPPSTSDTETQAPTTGP
jgi:eukaryotic-like serine/threonine-protein kinase